MQCTHLYNITKPPTFTTALSTDSNLLQKLVPKIGVRADYSLLQMAALVTKLVSLGQVQTTVGAQKKVLAIITKRGWVVNWDFQIQTFFGNDHSPIENFWSKKGGRQILLSEFFL